MKCHRALCASSEMSEIQQLVVRGSARSWWEIIGESRTIWLEITKTSLQRFLCDANISGFQKAFFFWLQFHFRIKNSTQLVQIILFSSQKCKFQKSQYFCVQRDNVLVFVRWISALIIQSSSLYNEMFS